MKKLLLALIFLLMATPVFASPFLVCEAYDVSVGVTKFTGTVDGVPFETAYSLHPTGPAIVFDMVNMDLKVPHTFGDIRAWNVAGRSDPGVTFVSPIVPNAPLNLRFIP